MNKPTRRQFLGSAGLAVASVGFAAGSTLGRTGPAQTCRYAFAFGSAASEDRQAAECDSVCRRRLGIGPCRLLRPSSGQDPRRRCPGGRRYSNDPRLLHDGLLQPQPFGDPVRHVQPRQRPVRPPARRAPLQFVRYRSLPADVSGPGRIPDRPLGQIPCRPR